MNGYVKSNKNHHIPQIAYVFTENNEEFPIIDITHPLFISSIDEKAYHISNIKSADTIKFLKKMPGFLKTIFIKKSDVDNSYLSGMRTMIYKMGPNLIRGLKLNFRDRWSARQDYFMGLRIRLREDCRYQAKILISKLKEIPEKNLCFFNIGGGPSPESINTLFLIQAEDPELLKGRKIEINVLDIDKVGPDFAKRCIDLLKKPGEKFCELDISLNTIPYDWRYPEKLTELINMKADWIQICSSEGGLFEYGSDEEIIQNLNYLYNNSTQDMKIVGSMIFDKENVSPGYLGFAEFTGVQVKFLGMDGLNNILSKTKWELECKKEIDTIFVVFTLKKLELT